MNCPYCGKPIALTDRFCPNCGSDLGGTETIISQVPPPTPPPPPAEETIISRMPSPAQPPPAPPTYPGAPSPADEKGGRNIMLIVAVVLILLCCFCLIAILAAYMLLGEGILDEISREVSLAISLVSVWKVG